MTRRITDSEKQYLLSINYEDIDYDLGMELFGDRYINGKIVKSKFEPSDVFKLKKGEYFNRTDIETTVGSFIFNKFVIEPRFAKHIDYVNWVITSGGLRDVDSELADLLKKDIITTEDFIDYLERVQWLGMQFHEPLAASFTMRGMKPPEKVIKERDRLIAENKEAIEKGDIITMVDIENKLIKVAEDEIGDDPSMDLYYSGARGSISNNYKQLSIVKGPIMNFATGKYEFVHNNFYEGVVKDDISGMATNVTNGSFPKASQTKESGYKSKQINAALQSVVLREDIQDCGSKGYLEVLLTKELANKCDYRYIIDKGKLVLLTPENKDKYIGTIIKMRSIMYCGCDYGVCLTCAGLNFKKLGIKAVGLTGNGLTGSLLELKMKAFHDTSVKTTKIDLNDITF